MGYLDGTSVTVDAVLTKKGREILSRGQQLDITSFCCTDTGVDYTLWNPDHPSGSAFYGEAIENLPMLEASVHAEYSLKNRLISLSQNTVTIPALELSGLTSTNTLTFEDGDSAGLEVVATLKGFADTGDNSGIYFVIPDRSVVRTNSPMSRTLSGTTRMFLPEQDIASAAEYTVTGGGPDFTMKFIPDSELRQAGRETEIYVVHRRTGAYTSFRVVNNLERLTRNILSNSSMGSVS
tara:strand:- start:666 stop:1376 length:711 start_codon:yes stop_codon:yes gene_type:complete